jgi:uncharacterized repeat protein (TIGR01451 family)
MMAGTVRRATAVALTLTGLALAALAAGGTAEATSGLPPAPLAPGAAWPGGKLSPALAERLLAEPTRPVSVLVQVRPLGAALAGGTSLARPGRAAFFADLQARQASASARLHADLAVAARAGHVTRVVDLWLAEALAVTATPATVLALAGRPDVRWVTLDGTAQLDAAPAGPSQSDGPGSSADNPLWNIRLVQADRVWHQLGIDGSGVTVGVIDSGVDYHHPALQTRFRGYVAGAGEPYTTGNWWCPESFCGNGAAYPWDAIGHGTHVTGSILGGEGVGVAPGARWVAALVCPNENECVDSWVLQAMQWLVAPERPVAEQPGVMNGSFSTRTTDDLVYKAAVDNLVAGNVVVVAATGNTPGFVGAPASYPSAIGVGALTDEGQVWKNSGRGHSLAEGVKPEVVAPGVGITSTMPGGGWRRSTGTSMATPHVAGVVALLRQARPDLTPAEVKAVLQRTASPLTPQRVPDSASGWGTVNAFAAVASVLDVGHLAGRVARDPDGAVIPWARVRVAELNGDPLTSVDVGPDGRYELSFRPGEYLVVAEAFTFQSQIVRGVRIQAGVTTTLDLRLAPAEPMGTFSGVVRDAATGAQIAADIRLADVPPRFGIHADEYTGFSARLPDGTYRIRVERFGYRVASATVKIVAGTTTTGDYRLQPAPRLLLVDGDGWAYRGGAEYLADSLDRIGYLYDTHRVTDEQAGARGVGGPPTAAEMAGYDVVLWSSPFSSPGFVRGAAELGAYLAGGGRLLLTGQDALCNDAGTDVATDPCNRSATRQPYVQGQLFARVVRDNAATRSVTGTPDGPLAGLTFQLNGSDSMDNQRTPDVLATVNAVSAPLIATYQDGGGAALLASACLKHRAIALGFGFEGIDGAAMRDQVLERLLATLSGPPPEHRMLALATQARLVRGAGAAADFALTLHNTGAAADHFEVRVVHSDWPAEVWQAGFSAPLTAPIRLDSCAQVGFGVRVTVPGDAHRGDTGQTEVVVRSLDGGPEQRLTLTTATAAPVLLVDGDFFRNSEDRYVAALQQLGVPYDTWELGLFNSNPSLPPAELLATYPAVIWFTGYDWRPTGNLSLEAQRRLAQYLEGGGRLLFASEDFLMSFGATPYQAERTFRQDYLGVGEYLQDQGSAHQGPMTGAPGSIFEGVTGCSLDYHDPSEDVSDRLVPVATARPALVAALGGTVGLQYAARDFKTVFLAFDAGHLDAACAPTLLGRALDWFSPLTASRLAIVSDGRNTFGSGDTVRLSLTIANRGPRATPKVQVRWHVPTGAAVDPTTLPTGWTWAADSQELRWSGSLAANAGQEQVVALQLAADLPEGATLRSWADIDDGLGLGLSRAVHWRVNAADLATSTKAAPGGGVLDVGDQAAFVIAVVNTGNRPTGRFVVTDTLPVGLKLIPGSVAPAAGSAVDLSTVPNGIVWRGSVEPGHTASLAYSTRVVTYAGGTLRNRAVLDDGAGQRHILSAAVTVRPQLMLPIALAQVDPDP